MTHRTIAPCSRRARKGYALPLVMVILLLLMVAFAGLLTTVSGVSASMAQTLRQRKARLECQGLARVTGAAIAELVVAGTATREEIDRKLGFISMGARRDRIFGVQAEASIRDTGKVNTIALGPLQGLPYIERVISTRLRLKEDNEACRALTEQPVASFAVTQFSSLSGGIVNSLGAHHVQRCDRPEATMSVTAAPPGHLPTPLNHAIAYAPMSTFTALTAAGECPDVTYAAGGPGPEPVDLSLPLLSADLNNPMPQDMTNNPFAVRVQTLAAMATTGQGMLEATQKLPMLQADIRIINGVWHEKRPELSLDWPGTVLWSDSFDRSTIGDDGPRQFSWYERSNGDTALGEPEGRMLIGNEGVVSYGSAYWGEQLARTELCESNTPPCVLRASVEPLEPPETMVARATRINMTRSAFNTPGFQTASNTTTATDTTTSRQTPINLDLGFLVTAFNTTTNGELGTRFCLTDGCPRRQFNGILYVNNAASEYTYSDFTARVKPPVGNNYSSGAGAKNHVLTPLWAPASTWSGIASLEYGATNIFKTSMAHSGPVMGITDEVVFRTIGEAAEGNGGYGYNAVRITNAADLTAFNDTGFTLISALPVFIEGDFNTATAAGVRPSALIIAPTVIVSTPGIDAFYPANGSPFVPPLAGVPSGPRFRIHASIVRTYSTPQQESAWYNARLLAGTAAYAATHGILSLNPNAVIELHGAITTIPNWVRSNHVFTVTYQPGVRVEQHYPLELTTATVRTDADRRLPPGTPRVSFVQGTVLVN